MRNFVPNMRFLEFSVVFLGECINLDEEYTYELCNFNIYAVMLLNILPYNGINAVTEDDVKAPWEHEPSTHKPTFKISDFI